MVGAAVLIVLLITACQEVRLRYARVVSPREGHPVGVYLPQFWSPHAPTGPLAMALTDRQVALLWPRSTRQFEVLYRAYGSSGPCGPPGPESTVERGREDIATSCVPGGDSLAPWQSRRLPRLQARLVAVCFSAGHLWLALANRTNIETLTLDVPSLHIARRRALAVRGVSAISLRAVGGSEAPLIAVVQRSEESRSRLELFRVDKVGFHFVGGHDVARSSPLALTAYKSGYALAVNRGGLLEVETASTGSQAPHVLRRYPGTATSVSLNEAGDALLLAASLDRGDSDSFVAGTVSPRGRLLSSPNPDSFRALVSGSIGGHVTVWLLRGRQRPPRAWTILRWSPHLHRFVRSRSPESPGGTGDAHGSVVGVFGGLATVRDPQPMHQAFIFMP
jgi:hypothetical protein